MRHHATGVARNYLALGSGFFEGEGSNGTFVPERILEALRADKLVTSTCEKDLFVNPRACQAVAEPERQSWIKDREWTIRAAHKPTYFGEAPRSLQAKFIFSANWREGFNNCSSAWVYLGNLTNPGFMKEAGSAGNLEAGVVFAPEGLRWYEQGKKDDGADVVTNRLPMAIIYLTNHERIG